MGPICISCNNQYSGKDSKFTSLSYFLTNQKLNNGDTVSIDGDEARHILLSRRMKPGEKFELQGEGFLRFESEVVKAGKNSLTVQILRQVEVPAELPVAITLYISYLQEKALDFVLQKSTELGAARIVIFNSQNTATKLSADQFISKSVRWNKILWESAKQCGRPRVPGLEFRENVNDVIESAQKESLVFLCDVSGSRINHVNPGQSFKSCAIITGPEGGFSPLEIENLKSSIKNLKSLNLSPFTLRAETAAITSLSIMQQLI